MADPADDPASAAPRADASAKPSRNRRTLIVLALVGFAPVVASYVAYYFFPREARVNYGVLLGVPAPAIDGTRFDGTPFALATLRGRWVVLIAAGERCERACERMLYATRQARTMQGREQDRVVRALVLSGDDPPQPELLGQHPGIVVVHASGKALAELPQSADAIYLVDPLGNLVLRYSDDPDIKRLAKDLERVLRASGVG